MDIASSSRVPLVSLALVFSRATLPITTRARAAVLVALASARKVGDAMVRDRDTAPTRATSESMVLVEVSSREAIAVVTVVTTHGVPTGTHEAIPPSGIPTLGRFPPTHVSVTSAISSTVNPVDADVAPRPAKGDAVNVPATTVDG